MDPFVPSDTENKFRQELTAIINRFSRENASDTPDFILAEYLTDCLRMFETATRERERWYGRYVLGQPGAPGEPRYPRANQRSNHTREGAAQCPTSRLT